MNKPMVITTTTHAMALAVYALLIVLAGGFLINLIAARSLTEMIGQVGVSAWALVFLAGGLCSLIGALWSPRMAIPRRALRTEAVGCVALTAAMGTLLWSYMGSGAFATQVMSTAFILGALFRALQIRRELRNLRRALVNPEPTDPPPLAASDA